MQSLESYLTCQHKVTSRADLKAKLKTMWFDLYPRSGSSSIDDTSGFEHVMVGEYKSNSVVNGFHNWISFYERKIWRLELLRVCETQHGRVGVCFSWSSFQLGR